MTEKWILYRCGEVAEPELSLSHLSPQVRSSFEESQNVVIAHCVAHKGSWQKRGSMGAITKELGDEAEEAYEEAIDELNLGDVQVTEIVPPKNVKKGSWYVATMIVQRLQDMQGQVPQVDLQAFEKCLKKCCGFCKKNKCVFHFAALDSATGLNWSKVASPLLHRFFVTDRVPVIVYTRRNSNVFADPALRMFIHLKESRDIAVLSQKADLLKLKATQNLKEATHVIVSDQGNSPSLASDSDLPPTAIFVLRKWLDDSLLANNVQDCQLYLGQKPAATAAAPTSTNTVIAESEEKKKIGVGAATIASRKRSSRSSSSCSTEDDDAPLMKLPAKLTTTTVVPQAAPGEERGNNKNTINAAPGSVPPKHPPPAVTPQAKVSTPSHVVTAGGSPAKASREENTGAGQTTTTTTSAVSSVALNVENNSCNKQSKNTGHGNLLFSGLSFVILCGDLEDAADALERSLNRHGGTVYTTLDNAIRALGRSGNDNAEGTTMPPSQQRSSQVILVTCTSVDIPEAILKIRALDDVSKEVAPAGGVPRSLLLAPIVAQEWVWSCVRKKRILAVAPYSR